MRTTVVPETVFKHVDKHGCHYEVVDRFNRSPPLEIFYASEALYVRQEFEEDGVNMIELTTGQATDLLYALSKVLEIPINIK